eukprot:TRINITY_DN2676_c0_g1_i2.p1 TRINITY_DN2676_c0_g1~~TRINITY_DN2676_c0_g1_i2.p1  ORF type:complete len:161 (-),score=15.66 TRINITY_DN2676_c0_g1_i2:122-562(-)
MEIGHKISQGLGIEGDVCREWPIQFRINKYSFTEESVGSLGVQLHTDSGFLTIVQEDECVGGLEVMDKSGQFISIDPIPGSLLVNLGDVAKVIQLDYIYQTSSGPALIFGQFIEHSKHAYVPCDNLRTKFSPSVLGEMPNQIITLA